MNRPSVLIVDDHAGFRAMARELLSSHGFDVVGEAVDGRDAIRAAADLHPAVVVLDIRLPDLDGFEVTRRLLADPPGPAVILVSTRDAADYGRRITTSGALGFIPKSRLSGDTLSAILRRHLEEQT
jgi:DNA-binding NarL/FixJ family response regulator